MTTAPANLLAVRRLLLDHLNVDPNTVRSQDLEPGEVGIVGDPAHRGGYHCGADRVVTNDYSVTESPRDRTGLADWACALDVGAFSVSVAGKRHDLPAFSIWLVAQCKADAVDTRDIREVIYSPDGSTVRRWDRLGRRSSGDDSHRWHTHISYHRDAIRAGRDQTALFRRYLTYIGILEDDMTPEELLRADVLPNVPGDQYTVGGAIHTTLIRAGSIAQQVAEIRGDVDALGPAVTALAAKVDQLGTAPTIDYDQLAAALPPALAKQVADELAGRLQA